ncbi:MAG: hypothetical protein LBR68_03245 [Lachnoclostridium sp.]|nr:hypothetical protein [Lachnoclostridium sp.]
MKKLCTLLILSCFITAGLSAIGIGGGIKSSAYSRTLKASYFGYYIAGETEETDLSAFILQA